MDATSIQAGGEPAELKAPLPKVPRPAPEEQKTAEEPKEDHSAKQGPLPAPPLPNDPQNIQPIDYAPPAWSAKPPDTDKFTLEIVKDGYEFLTVLCVHLGTLESLPRCST